MSPRHEETKRTLTCVHGHFFATAFLPFLPSPAWAANSAKRIGCQRNLQHGDDCNLCHFCSPLLPFFCSLAIDPGESENSVSFSSSCAAQRSSPWSAVAEHCHHLSRHLCKAGSCRLGRAPRHPEAQAPSIGFPLGQRGPCSFVARPAFARSPKERSHTNDPIQNRRWKSKGLRRAW
jgi:hypothetical protein